MSVWVIGALVSIKLQDLGQFINVAEEESSVVLSTSSPTHPRAVIGKVFFLFLFSRLSGKTNSSLIESVDSFQPANKRLEQLHNICIQLVHFHHSSVSFASRDSANASLVSRWSSDLSHVQNQFSRNFYDKNEMWLSRCRAKYYYQWLNLSRDLASESLPLNLQSLSTLYARLFNASN